MSNNIGSQKGLHAGIFILSVALIALQIVYTRFFAFSLWHYMAYLVISISMLGLGAAGVFLSVSRTALNWELRRAAPLASLGFAISVLVGLSLICRIELDVLRLDSPLTHLKILIYYTVLALPYVFCGLVLSLSFMRFPENVGKLYAYNMIGSGAGCLVITPLMWSIGLPGALLVCALLGAISAVCFWTTFSEKIPNSAIATLVISVLLFAGLLPFRETIYPVHPAPSKLLTLLEKEWGKTPEYTRWTPISRIDVVDTSPHVPNRKAILQDGDALSFLHEWDGDDSKLDYLDNNIAAGSYRILDKPKALIIGIGGGPDILIAHHNDASEVTAVEINPGSIEVLTELYNDYSGNIATVRPTYKVVNSEGRSYVKRSQEKYDLIQIPGADSFTALQSGAYMVAESYLYTVEAMKDYLAHLTDGGVLGIVRISFDPPREHLKLVSSAATAMRDMEIGDPRTRTLVIRDSRYIYLTLSLFKKEPFTQKEISSYAEWIAENPDYYPVYAPGANLDNPYTHFLDAFAEGNEEIFYDDYFYNVRPATDDSPFFFQHDKLKNILKELPVSRQVKSPGESQTWSGFTSFWESDVFREKGLGLWMLVATILQMGLLTAFYILAPLYFHKKHKIKAPNFVSLLIYFSCLGIAYVSIEISFIQRLILFLGHPTYSTTVVLFTFLIFSGIGSATTSYFKTVDRKNAWIAISLLFIVGILTHLVTPAVIDSTLGYPLMVRMGVALLLLAPLSFLMGMPFPFGVRIANRYSIAAMIPWAWGVNSALSVVGSIVCVAIAMQSGFSKVLLLMLVVYLIAAIILIRLKPMDEDSDSN